MLFIELVEYFTEAVDRFVDKMFPWLIGFSAMYITAHVLVAQLKGWI